MNKKLLAYDKLSALLGTKIATRRLISRVAEGRGQMVSQELLLIPKQVAATLGLPPDGEPYTDVITKQEFIAFVIAEILPRAKGRVPEPQQAVDATEEDSTRPLSQADHQNASSIHSTIPRNPSTSEKSADSTLFLNSKLLRALEAEFDAKFRQASGLE